MSIVRTFAKKRESICAAQWTGEMTPEITELLGDHLISVDKDELVFANAKGPGRFARKGDWIGSSSDGELFVIGDAQFRKIYEEVDETERISDTLAFDIVANGGAFQVIHPPHVVDGDSSHFTIEEPIYVVRQSELVRALRYAEDRDLSTSEGTA
jgi:hypothetical protein